MRKYIFLVFMLFSLSASLFAQKKKKSNLVKERREISAQKNFIEGEKHYLLENYTKALGYFIHALENSPNNAGILYKVGETYLKINEFNKAEAYAQKALILNSKNKYYYLLVSEIYKTQLRFQEAAIVYENLLRALPKEKEYLFDLAAIYLYDNQLDKGLEVYDRAEKHFGKSPEIAFAKQQIFLRQNKLDEAIKEGEKLVAIFPSEEKYVISLARLLASNNRLEESKKVLEKLVEESPNSVEGRLLLSDVYSKTNQPEKSKANLEVIFADPSLAINAKIELLAGFMSQLPNEEVEAFTQKLATKMVEAHPDDANSYVMFGDILLKSGKRKEALEKYSKAIDIDDSSFNVWLNIFQIELEQGQTDNLLKHSERALELFPNQAIIYFYNGMANMSSKHFEQAVEMLSHGKKLCGKDENLKNVFNGQLGEAFNGTKEYEKSDMAFDAALQFNPSNYAILNNYSYYLSLRKEKLKQAKKMAGKVVKDNPNNATYLDTYAWVLYVMEDYKGAKKYLERAIKNSATNGTIIEHYGDVLFKLGDVDKAVRQWEKAKSLIGNSEFIDKKIAHRKLYE